MGALLPWLLILVAVAGLLGGLASLWLSLSLALSGEGAVGFGAAVSHSARLALLNEKEALLQEIQDVAFEHEAGKLSDADYEELNAKLRARARHVLQALDAEVEGFRAEAEALIARRVGKEP